MYVISLIGRYADEASAFLMPKHAAEVAVINGTHRLATEDEVLKAGFVMSANPSDADPDKFPLGFSTRIDNGGYALFRVDANGDEQEVGFYANNAAARSGASDIMALESIASGAKEDLGAKAAADFAAKAKMAPKTK